MSFIRNCPTCGTKNRIPARHLADAGRCGACKAALPPIAEPLAVDPAEFDEIVQESRVPVLVDFWASWCGPCRMAAPHGAQTAHELAGRAVVLKVDTEEHPALAARYQVQGIPNFAVFFRCLCARRTPVSAGRPSRCGDDEGLADARRVGGSSLMSRCRRR